MCYLCARIDKNWRELAMIIYNTTYTVPNEDARDFVIWIHQAMIPEALSGGRLAKPRLLRILSHRDPDTECFSLQLETQSTAMLHKWFVEKGNRMQQELDKLFDKRVAYFSTIMEVVSEEEE